jgi:hypothetical protein
MQVAVVRAVRAGAAALLHIQLPLMQYMQRYADTAVGRYSASLIQVC